MDLPFLDKSFSARLSKRYYRKKGGGEEAGACDLCNRSRVRKMMGRFFLKGKGLEEPATPPAAKGFKTQGRQIKRKRKNAPHDNLKRRE